LTSLRLRLRPKDVVDYERVLGLTPEEVNRPHPAAKKRKLSEPTKREQSDGRFEWRLPELANKTVKANTKSEARAAFKRMLGLERLPVGTIVQKAEA
jgi:hypothetical protein